jgi:hypothetical protein
MDPRTKAIEDVREIFSRAPTEVPPRVCPNCGAESVTQRAFCPSCGKRYDRRFARVSDTQRWILAGLAVAGVIVAAILILPGVFDAKRSSEARAAREQAATIAALKRKINREQRPMHGRPARLHAPAATAGASEQRAARHQLVTAFKGAILADARHRVQTGEIDGPIRRVMCGPLIRSLAVDEVNDLSKPRARFDCVAVKRDVIKDGKVVGYFGHPFVGTTDFKRFSYVWCKDNKVPSEGGRLLVKVPIPAVCIGDEGQPRVGDGYLSATP